MDPINSVKDSQDHGKVNAALSIQEENSDGDVAVGSVEVTSPDNGWSRGLSTGQVIMLALGGGIGTGLWVGTGTALSHAGPGGCAIAYGLVTLSIYFEFMAIGEMTCFKPIYGGWFRQNMEYIDPAVGFATGLNYWFSWTMIISSEVIAAINVLEYWEAARGFPLAAYITIFLIAGAIPNFFAISTYGHIEFVMGVIKVFAITMSMAFLFIYVSGGVPGTGGAIVFRYWSNPGAFHNGMKGICKALLQAGFSIASASYIATCAGEMKDPRRTIKKAITPLFGRAFLFYVVNIWLVGMAVPYDDTDLNNNSGTLASPFVIAIKRAGVPVLPDILNVLIFITVASCAITSYYLTSRALTSLSELNLIHPIFNWKDKKGRPWISLVISGVLGGGLTYLNLNDTSQQVYGWFSNLVASATFLEWAAMFISHIRFRQGLKEQGIDYKTLPFRSWAGVMGSYLGLLLSVFYLVVEFYYALYGSGEPTAKGFFSSYITVPLFFIDLLVYKWYFGTKIVKPAEMDFTAAEYFDEIDREHLEQERESRVPNGLMNKVVHFWR